MSGETENAVSGWTTDTWAAHTTLIDQQRLRYEQVIRDLRDRLQEERDRRYAEVATEREKALKIKETADLAALGLAREIQTYKDEKANELRSQIERERGSYPTRGEMVSVIEKVQADMKPLSDYVSSVQGRDRGFSQSWAVILAAIFLALAVGGFVVTLVRP